MYFLSLNCEYMCIIYYLKFYHVCSIFSHLVYFHQLIAQNRDITNKSKWAPPAQENRLFTQPSRENSTIVGNYASGNKSSPIQVKVYMQAYFVINNMFKYKYQ